MKMRSSKPPRASVIAFSFGTSSFIATSVSLMKILPLMSTDSCSGVLSCSRLLAWVCGKSRGTPTVRSGAETMKMINSTSMTSTIGVTLISAITALRRPRRPPPAVPPEVIPMISDPKSPLAALASCPLVDLARQDRGKLVGKPLQPLRLPVHLRGELVVENCRRNCGDQADRGGKKRFRNAGRDHRQRGVLRGCDRREARHDAPDRAEQADKGTCGSHGGEHQKPPLQPLDLARDRH